MYVEACSGMVVCGSQPVVPSRLMCHRTNSTNDGADCGAGCGNAGHRARARLSRARWVADAWNPLRLMTMRDVPNAELVVDIDQGGLREGPRLVRYRAPLPAGGGMAVFEDDIYLPPRWRSFAWAVRSGDVTLASGTFDPRVALNPRALAARVGGRGGTVAGAF